MCFQEQLYYMQTDANCFTGKRYQQIYELLLNFIVMQKYISHVKDLLCIKAQQAEYFKY